MARTLAQRLASVSSARTCALHDGMRVVVRHDPPAAAPWAPPDLAAGPPAAVRGAGASRWSRRGARVRVARGLCPRRGQPPWYRCGRRPSRVRSCRAEHRPGCRAVVKPVVGASSARRRCLRESGGRRAWSGRGGRPQEGAPGERGSSCNFC